jgi:hypothetical protein
MDCLSDIAHDAPMPVIGRKDLLNSEDIHEGVDKDDEPLYNIYYKGDYED